MHPNKHSSLFVCFALGPGAGGTALGPGAGGTVPGSGPGLPAGGKTHNLTDCKLLEHYPVLYSALLNS